MEKRAISKQQLAHIICQDSLFFEAPNLDREATKTINESAQLNYKNKQILTPSNPLTHSLGKQLFHK